MYYYRSTDTNKTSLTLSGLFLLSLKTQTLTNLWKQSASVFRWSRLLSLCLCSVTLEGVPVHMYGVTHVNTIVIRLHGVFIDTNVTPFTYRYVPTYSLYVFFFFFCCGAATQRRSWPPHSWGLYITHNDAAQSVALIWTTDQLVAETSTWQNTTLTTDKYPCPRWDSNPRSQQASGSRPTP